MAQSHVDAVMVLDCVLDVLRRDAAIAVESRKSDRNRVIEATNPDFIGREHQEASIGDRYLAVVDDASADQRSIMRLDQCVVLDQSTREGGPKVCALQEIIGDGIPIQVVDLATRKHQKNAAAQLDLAVVDHLAP